MVVGSSPTNVIFFFFSTLIPFALGAPTTVMKRSATTPSTAVDEKWIQRALKRVNGHTIRLIADELLHCNGETWTELWEKVRATNVLETVETLVIDSFEFDNVDALPKDFEAPNLTTLVLKDTAS